MTPRSILITGCSSGIGQACAIGMRLRGWRVFATARKASDILVLRDAGLEAMHLDYLEPDSIAACAGDVLSRTGGRLNAVFNNGMYAQPGAVEDVRPDVLRAQFEAGFFGWHDLTRRLIPSMRAAGEGRIVNCSSVLGLVSVRYRGAYAATKFALEALTDALRQELAGSGIHVALIEPGPVRTRLVEHSVEAYRLNIDLENSAHREVYLRRIARMEQGGTNRFKVEPEAVLRTLVHAVESPRPRPRYRVTVPARVAGLARRLLSTRMLDVLLRGQ